MNSKGHLTMIVKSFQKKKERKMAEFTNIHLLILLENTQCELKFGHISTLQTLEAPLTLP